MILHFVAITASKNILSSIRHKIKMMASTDDINVVNSKFTISLSKFNQLKFKKLAVARIHEKVRNQRLDLHHKVTHKLICENQATSHVIEYLGVKNMVKNHKKQALADVAGLATV